MKNKTKGGLSKYLLSLGKEELADMILSRAEEDTGFKNELLSKAEEQDPDIDKITAMKKMLQRGIVPGGHVGGYGVYKYWRSAEAAIDGLRGFLRVARGVDAMLLCEYAIEKADKAAEVVDDSFNGCLSEMMVRLEGIYYDACVIAKPDPVLLARRLFTMHTESNIDIFYKAAARFSRLLGESGLAEFKRVVTSAWVALSETEKNDRHGEAFKIICALEDLAEISGDTEGLIAIKSRDLRYPYSYLEIAQIYEKAGNRQQAIEWAQNGIANFPKFQDSRVKDFLAELYVKEDRKLDALRLMWENYGQKPEVETYEALKIYADLVNDWPSYRDKAMGFLRDGIESEKDRKTMMGEPIRSHNEAFIKILLWEKNDDAAWDAAVRGGCWAHVWETLAEARLKSHPLDAVYAYSRIVDSILLKANKPAYRNAAAYIKDIRGIMAQNRKEAEYAAYISGLREKHRAKKTFIELLDKKKM